VDAIASIASSAFPPARGFRELVDESRNMRKKDFENSPPNTIPEYSEETKKRYQKIGKYMKSRTALHNKLLLEATASALSERDIIRGGIANYEAKQGAIREELLKVIQRVSGDLGVTRSDFRNPAIGRVAVESLTVRKVSGDASKNSLKDAINSNKPILDRNDVTRSELHHLGFKSSEDDLGNKYLEKDALRPDNIALVNGERSRNDGSVDRSQWGGHEWIHRATGFKDGDKEAKRLGYGQGSHFDRMDPQAVRHVMEPILVPRTTKTELYHLTLKERINEYSKQQSEQGNTGEAQKLKKIMHDMSNIRGSRNNGGVSEVDADTYARSELNKLPIGQEILRWQDQADAKVVEARRRARGEATPTRLRNRSI